MEFQRRKLTADYAQLLLPIFRPIYTNEQEERERIRRILDEFGIDIGIFEEYTFDLGDQPYLTIHLAHENTIPVDKRVRINQIAGEVMINTLRSFLGIQIPDTPK